MRSARYDDRLYSLLPAIHRMRDAERGYALQGLLRLLGREGHVVEDDLDRLYASWFIETCPDWIVPYIGDLVGYTGAPEGLMPLRRDVANTVRDRRRKGTLALLESIARDTTGWAARAVEMYRQLARTQYLNSLFLERGRAVDVRRGDLLEHLDGPFGAAAHVVDVRRPSSTLTTGLYNIPSIVLFAWRLRAFTVTHCQADCVEDIGPQCYAFSALGNDTELFSQRDLPIPLTRRMLEERPHDDSGGRLSKASADYYGLGKSLAIWAPDWPVKGAPQPVPREAIVPADLTEWKYQAPANHIAVDPELGRFVFPARQLPKGSVYVSYAYGFSAEMGGGEYDRTLFQPDDAVVYRVGGPGGDESIRAALTRWQSTTPRPRSAVIEIVDSRVYTEPLAVDLERDEHLQLRAAVHARPVLRLLDYIVDRPDPFSIRGKRGSSFTLDGILVTGRGLAVHGNDQGEGSDRDDDLCEVVIRHCTLVPGWGMRENCEPIRPAEPSIELLGTRARLRIEHSIVGSIVVSASQSADEPLEIAVSDSVLDSTGHDCSRPDCDALTGPGGAVAHAAVTLRDVTVFGHVRAHMIRLAENTIFTGVVRVARRQVGCVRFSYVPPGSRTPPRFECQPDRDGALPRFVSTRYGTADYARHADDCPEGIREGADDRSEMGVFHDLHEPQRAQLLRQRLQEFTPAGTDAGLIFLR